MQPPAEQQAGHSHSGAAFYSLCWVIVQANWAEERAKGGITGAHPAAERSVEHMGAVAFRDDGDAAGEVPEGVDRPMRINRLSTDEWRSQ
mgnify:CR=1 FL=1